MKALPHIRRITATSVSWQILLASSTLLPAFAGVALAQQAKVQKASDAKPTLAISTNEPVLLEAEQMHYDKEQAVVTATGKVEVAQGETLLLADSISYDQNNQRVRASGNVSVLEPSGNVYFAEEVELQNEMQKGVIENFRARLADNSLFAAREARKIDENITELDQAVYSPCNVCDALGNHHNPLWQIKASKVRYDKAEQLITYDDAYFEIYGVPTLYTPYLSHATPNADNKSGLLFPEYSHNENLGSIIKVPYYYSISPDKDMTITPIWLTRENPVLSLEYRQMFNNGSLYTNGSITVADKRDAQGNEIDGNDWRGHINAIGDFSFREASDWGFQVRRSTDDTYLRRYELGDDNETVLTSRAYVQTRQFVNPAWGDSSRSYARAQALTFQGLTALDDSKRIPVIAPLAEAYYESNPQMGNSRFFISGNTLSLTRDIGADSRRLSVAAGWKLPYITSNGQIFEVEASVRGDGYYVQDVTLANGRDFDGEAGRVIPQVNGSWRYPFVKRLDGASTIIEPVVQVTYSPKGGNSEKISNEDSLFPELTDANLFSTNRYAGYDRVETGLRGAYGLRSHTEFSGGQSVSLLFGQVFVEDDESQFPYTDDMNEQFSDYVGKLSFSYAPFDVAYRFQLAEEDFGHRRDEIDAALTFQRLRLSGAYLSLDDDPVLNSNRQVAASASLVLTQNWTLAASALRDLNNDQFINNQLGLQFSNECLTFTSFFGRDYTRDRDIKPDTRFGFRVGLKNLE